MVVTMTTPEERVRVIIGRSGLSQGEFASRIGLDPTKLSKSLSGVRRFTSLELAQIAELSVTTVDWILTGEESVLATAARASHGGSAAMALDQATELVELRESAARLGYPQAWTPVARREGQAGVPRGPAYAQGAQLAGDALAHLDSLGLHPVTLDLAGLVEAAFGADVCLAPLGEGFDGLAVTTPQARVIVAACGGQPYRQRFTIAHELGHLLAGDDQVPVRALPVAGVDGPPPGGRAMAHLPRQFDALLEQLDRRFVLLLDAQHIAQKIDQHQRHPKRSEFELNYVHSLCH